MTEIAKVTLENEMDIVMVHKRMIAIGEYLRFTITTQTAFSTAIAEVSREVIDKTNTGLLVVSIKLIASKYFLCGRITFLDDAELKESDEGMSYAKRLVPQFEFHKDGQGGWIELQIGIPRSSNLSPLRVSQMGELFGAWSPSTPYEALKVKNSQLNAIKEEQDEELRQSKYLHDMKTEFISIASHELKTPLTTIKAYIEMLMITSQQESSPKMIGFIKKINEQGTKLQQLIEQLLDISKVEAGRMDYQMEPVKLGGYVEGVVDTFRMLYPSHTIVIESDDIDTTIMMDKLRIEQVFANLLGNAAKYSETGTVITVGYSIQKDGSSTVSITDQGIGMNAEASERVFGKFYRADKVIKKYGGMGMGLYICKNIIEAHRGEIWLESQEDKGSTFYFRLPNVG